MQNTWRQQLAVLGLSGDVTLGDLKKAYRRLITHYHPDRHASNSEAERINRLTEKCKEINEAYTYLVKNFHGQARGPNLDADHEEDDLNNGRFDSDLLDGEQALIVEISPVDDFFNRREFWLGCRVLISSPLNRGDGWYCVHTSFQAGSRQLAQFAEGALFARVRLRRVRAKTQPGAVLREEERTNGLIIAKAPT